MNYNQALNYTISDKLTKAKLIEISNTLQDHCLVKELETPTGLSLIKEGLIKVIATLKYELPLLVKDVKNSGQSLRQLVTIKRD
jgi:hypothetical protein